MAAKLTWTDLNQVRNNLLISVSCANTITPQWYREAAGMVTKKGGGWRARGRPRRPRVRLHPITAEQP